MEFDDAVQLFVGTIIILAFAGVALQILGINFKRKIKRRDTNTIISYGEYFKGEYF